VWNILEMAGSKPLNQKSSGLLPFNRSCQEKRHDGCLTENGELHLVNRRGELQTKSGIPLVPDFKQTPHFKPNEFEICMNQLVGFPTNGEDRAKINFKGEVIYKKSLVKKRSRQ